MSASQDNDRIRKMLEDLRASIRSVDEQEKAQERTPSPREDEPDIAPWEDPEEAAAPATPLAEKPTEDAEAPEQQPAAEADSVREEVPAPQEKATAEAAQASAPEEPFLAEQEEEPAPESEPETAESPSTPETETAPAEYNLAGTAATTVDAATEPEDEGEPDLPEQATEPVLPEEDEPDTLPDAEPVASPVEEATADGVGTSAQETTASAETAVPDKNQGTAASEIRGFYVPPTEGSDTGEYVFRRPSAMPEERPDPRFAVGNCKGVPMGDETREFLLSNYDVIPSDGGSSGEPTSPFRQGEAKENAGDNTWQKRDLTAEEEALLYAEEEPAERTQTIPAKPQRPRVISAMEEEGQAATGSDVPFFDGASDMPRNHSFVDESLTTGIPRRAFTVPPKKVVHSAAEEQAQEAARQEAEKAKKTPAKPNRRGQSSFGSNDGNPVEIVGRGSKGKANIQISNLSHEQVGDRLRLKEYTSPADADLVRGDFVIRRRWRVAGVIAQAALLLFALLIENLPLLGVKLPFYFTGEQMAPVAILLNLQLLIFSCAICIPDFLRGIRELRGGELGAEAIAMLPPLLCVVYDIALLILGAESPRLLAGAGIFCLFILQVNGLLRLSCARRAFEFVASPGDKLVQTVMTPEESAAERQALGSTEDAQFTRIRKTEFAEGVLHRTEHVGSYPVLYVAQMVMMLLCGVGVTVICGMTQKPLPVCFAGFVGGALLCFGVSMLCCRTLPMLFAVCSAAKDGSMIVGEDSVYEYADTDAVVFEDVVAFSFKYTDLAKIKLYGNQELSHVLCYTAALFDRIGGPLKSLFDEATLSIPSVVAEELLALEEEGVTVKMQGRAFSVGSGRFMQEKGVKVQYDPDDQTYTDRNCAVLYAAENGKVSAKFYINYRVDPDFVKIARKLFKKGIRCVIRTADPGLNDRQLGKVSTLYDEGVRMVRKTPEGLTDFCTKRTGGGLLTSAGTEDLLALTLYSRRVRTVLYGQSVFALLGSALGCVLGILWAILLPETALFAVSAAIVGVQAVLLGISVLTSLLPLRRIPRMK